MKWQEMETYAFLHFSLNTYTDQEWGYGNESPRLFNPSQLDVRQWVSVCKNAGMKGIILTAKHHCGFCLWPSDYTDYSVKSAPWKDGRGDVVGELAAACKAAGLKFGVYLSPWDRHQASYGQPEYVTYFRHQLQELLTRYGDIFEVWFDGANGGSGYYGGTDGNRQIDGHTYYQWAGTFSMIRRLQPTTVIWSDAGERADTRWVGTEAGYVGATNWSPFSKEGKASKGELHHGSENGSHWIPAEVNTSIRPGWFYHRCEDSKVKSVGKLIETYYKSVGRNGTLLLNFPIMPNGLINEHDAHNSHAFFQAVRTAFSDNLAATAKVSATNVRGRSKTYAARHATDASADSYWATDNGITHAALTLAFPRPTTFNRFLVQEYIRLGQRVRAFSIEAFVNGRWQQLKDALDEEGTGLTTIGYKRIVCFPTVTATRLRFTILDARACPTISNIGVYLAPEITEPALPAAPGQEEVSEKAAWVPVATGSPLEMAYDMGATETLTGFSYLPPSETGNGLVTDYSFHVSPDGVTWTQVARGEFANIVNNPIRQFVSFSAVRTRFIKLKAERLAEGEKMACRDLDILH